MVKFVDKSVCKKKTCMSLGVMCAASADMMAIERLKIREDRERCRVPHQRSTLR